MTNYSSMYILLIDQLYSSDVKWQQMTQIQFIELDQAFLNKRIIITRIQMRLF